ncbi:uncharacterized protein LOC118185893 isoform X2 [Stegodyphus dumicola]|uniref:uncharacterized protein LOC118185893 isoform X2 n=1 Tax=Stegodyphus dumicola TaxID=202533 RepID=UPI0015A912C6|nr:uncharacterized protein LOC118185893 isoform X2 [Stegodyphus dumicola]
MKKSVDSEDFSTESQCSNKRWSFETAVDTHTSFPSFRLSEFWKKDILLQNEDKNFKKVSENNDARSATSTCTHTEAIMDYLKKIEKERLISNDTAEKVLNDLNKVIRKRFPGMSITLYGSYSCDLAVSTSDLNFALETNCCIKNPILFEIRKCLAKELAKYDVLPFDGVMSVKKSKICFIEPYTRVTCEVMYLGKYTENVHKMSGFLKALCSFDHRIKTLFIAARIWAEVCSIHETEDGRLPPVAFNLMVVHFLQQLEKPLLPIIDISITSWGPRCQENSNTSSVGELWLEFLNYYRTFNWEAYNVSIVDKHPVLKSSKSWKSPLIAIEDPFSGKNVAASVTSSDVADFIKYCFNTFYEYFSVPPKDCEACCTASLLNNNKYSLAINIDPHLPSPFSSSILSEVWKKDMLSLNEQHNSKTTSEKHKGSCVAARCAHIEALSDYLKAVEKERLISNDTAEKVLKDLNKVITRKFPGISVTLYGSYSCDLAVSTSNLNFALQTSCNIKNPILFEIRKCLAKELTKYDVLPFDEDMSVKKSKICFIEPYTRVTCEMMYLGKHTENVHKMSGFLKALCSFDHRIKTLFIAARIWAEVCSIHEPEDGRLPPVAFNLMVVYFLQQLEKPLLPIIDISITSWGPRSQENSNTSPVGELWLEFLNYYRTFNWEAYIVSIVDKHPVLKSSKSWKSPLIAVEDPFSGKNVAASVTSSDVADFIKYCFNTFYKYFSVPAKGQVRHKCQKRLYSFSMCDLRVPNSSDPSEK